MHRRLVPAVVLGLAALLVPFPVDGQEPPGEGGTTEAAAKTPPPPCTSADHRRFDFWIGAWEVKNQERPEVPAARNVITSVVGGCALREEYTAGPGYSGTSLSFWDAGAGLWRQTWIDDQGQPLLLAGGWRDGAMVMTGLDPASPTERITWTPRNDGSVRQHWERTADGGATWKTVFDGLYTRVAVDSR